VTAGIDVREVSGALGAEVRGISLSGLDDAGFARVHELLLRYQVVFFPEQDLSADDQIALASRYGPLHEHPLLQFQRDGRAELFVLEGERGLADNWHSDLSWEEEPCIVSVLKMVRCPSVGGDTMWSNQYLAYEHLSARMRTYLDGLTAIHRLPGRERRAASHPVVRRHPETGRRSLFVNRTFTERIDEVDPRESDAILGFLFDHCERPNFQCRYRWAKGTVAMWDNRCTQHFAVNDYSENRRVERVSAVGDRVTA
jgi:taurine dioxygenase